VAIRAWDVVLGIVLAVLVFVVCALAIKPLQWLALAVSGP
jgi:hypothetical protein